MKSDAGTEIATLRAELHKVPIGARVTADQARLNELQRLVDQRYALLRMTQARRQALAKEKTWVLFAMWSPVAVKGCRAWNLAADGLYGVRQRWPVSFAGGDLRQ